MTNSETDDPRWMRTALEAAERGLGLTAPNPPVGCALVKNEILIATGYHTRAGAPHAEIEALQAARDAGVDTTGATAYVTLEPCSTHGRTPPCTAALIAAGISRVVYATTDPNPAHAGRADSVLAAAKIEVTTGVLATDATDLIRGFAKRITSNLPWVIAKAATSLDGRLTRPPGEPRWLTGGPAREDAHHLRSQVDAIIVGAETVRTDDPSLTVRGAAATSKPTKNQPLRAILTRTGNIPESAKLLNDDHRGRTLIYQSKTPDDILADLATRGCNRVLLEGGGQLLSTFFAANLVDELALYLAPLWCGADTTPTSGTLALPASIQLSPPTVTHLGQDIRISFRVLR
ncbi:MAG: bifunctional diaminohydroxyphosphoribosylaminopyrimidine deaminase/5-amino-6-(5-phosphoribosylamino)uracil reductase RibD [Verrucomicrobiales bacterium]|nr:bifunctional diaminohydroxyphosphoribosylaminopyrimidine deaminase/5-amino-6-(5-phosphoribosylamino)uracil reductase RibD [Verrucomicrobiales bacterium]